MEEQVLTIEQMQELKELGIDTSKASMCWTPWKHVFKNDDKGMPILETIKTEYYLKVNNEKDYWEENIPTFTIQDIIEMLPATYGAPILIRCYKGWQCGFLHEDFDGSWVGKEQNGNTAVEAAFNLLKRNYYEASDRNKIS